jgi:flagellar protein FliS
MGNSAYAAYLESKILSADPVELVQILYRAALESVGSARRHLQQGDIAGRSKQISRAMSVITELILAVDRETGGTLAQNLLELYDYMQRRLIEANVEQKEEPLAEVGRLLGTLLEGWMQSRPATSPGTVEISTPALPVAPSPALSELRA